MHSLAALEYPRKEPGYIAGKSVRETYVVAPDTYVLPKPVRVTVGSSIAEGANFRCWEAVEKNKCSVAKANTGKTRMCMMRAIQ